jgi:hypothetical protein
MSTEQDSVDPSPEVRQLVAISGLSELQACGGIVGVDQACEQAMRSTTFVALLAIIAASAAAPIRSAQAARWDVFVVPGLGTRVDVPIDVFTDSDGKAWRGTGEQFKTSDGRAVLAVYALKNEGGLTPAAYLKDHLKTPASAMDYKRVAPSFFAVSAETKDMIYYTRCNFARRAGLMHCAEIKYPRAEKRAWDAIVTRVSLSLRPLER